MTIQEMHDALAERARQHGHAHGLVKLMTYQGLQPIANRCSAMWIDPSRAYPPKYADTMDEAIQAAFDAAMACTT